MKYWLKVINSGDNQLIRIVYEGMRRDTSCAKCDNWAMKVKTIFNDYGFGSAWLNQSVQDQNKFIVLFERRIKDNIIQHYFADIEASTRCRTYKDIKGIHDIEPYLQRDIHSSLRSAFTKLQLSSHRLMVKRGRWMKTKVQYIDRKCTLCNDNDIHDEYHIVLKCAFIMKLEENILNRIIIDTLACISYRIYFYQTFNMLSIFVCSLKNFDFNYYL